MKDRYIIGLLFVMNMLLRPIQVLAQDDSQNYIFVENYKSKREITSYYDGIGRKTLERIGAFAMVNPMKSIYTLTEYDLLGREKKLWQPAVDVNFLDEYKSDISNMSNKTYNDNRAFTEIEYDALGRQIFKSTAGDAWEGKGIRTKYITNDKEHPVRRYKLDSNGIPFNSPVDYYTSCTLTGTRVTDEDNHTIETYKDILGNVVLERRDGNNDTYFVYENGLLRTVIPPLYQDKKESSLLYRYEYDDYGRCKKKILSAGGTKYYWYDKYGRLSFMQDGLLRGKRNFRFYLYDGLGRVAIQGLTRDTIGKSDCTKYVAKVVFGTEGSPVGDTGYSFEDAFSISSPTIEIVNYYDGYDCLDMNAFDDVRTKVQIDKNICTTTLQTAQLVATSEGGQLARVMQYDTDGKCVVTTNTYPDKILVQTTTKYSSTDKPTSVVKSYYKDGSLIHTMNHKLEYDFVTDYLSKEKLTMDDEPTETLYENSYNGLGQIESVKMGKEGRIRENYLFDVHGWIKDHEFYNDNENHMPMFKEIIRYADGSKPCYNGNISTIENRRMYDVKVFDYEYDGMDRLVQTKYHDPNNTQKPGSRPEDYSEKFSYNANSALISLHRMGNDQYGSGNAIDELTYSYSGNQLQKVYDRAGNALIEGASDFQSYDDDREHYRYNSCGAMTMDVNKGIMDISYDNNGMPNRVQFKNGSVTEYLYSADGAKLKTIHRTAVDGITTYSYRELSPSETLSTDSTLYVDGCEFGDDFHALKYYYANGYVDWYYNRYTNFNFFAKDYLGNIRMDYNSKGNSRYYLNQMNNYYSYGGDRCDVDKNIIGMNYNIDAQYHKYNGKELDRMHGLRLYDYGARQYDPAIGLFTSVDPNCEKYYNVSPYAYCHANPVMRIDPDGKDDYTTNIVTGEIYRKKTDEITHSFYITNGNCSNKIGTFEYNEHNLIQMSGTVSFVNFDNQGVSITFSSKNATEQYMSPEAISALFGAVADVGIDDLYVTHFSNFDGSSPAPSKSHKDGVNGDLRYLRTDHSASPGLITDEKFDVNRQVRFNDALHKFGWGRTSNMISEYFGNHNLLPYSASAREKGIRSPHDNHLHLQGFAPNVIHIGGTLKNVNVICPLEKKY